MEHLHKYVHICQFNNALKVRNMETVEKEIIIDKVR